MIKLSKSEIQKYIAKYNQRVIGKNDEIVEKELREWFAHNRFLDREHFIKLCMWKSPRPKKWYTSDDNSEQRIKEITSLSISSQDEYFKIKNLQLLKGVSWPVASVILHFAQPDKYSILDFRAIWSLGLEKPSIYTFEFWQKYTKTVNDIARKLDISLRDLDKALWQYSKENQK